jgi:ketosteroid isomerase-like protein
MVNTRLATTLVCAAFLSLVDGAPHALVAVRAQATDAKLRADIDALNSAMVTAFKASPSGVARFYTDDAAIIGVGQRYAGRAAVDEYWKGASMFRDWTLETLEVGGPNNAPWQYGRSVLTGQSGRSMETYFIGLLRRETDGSLKFRADVFTRERAAAGADEGLRTTEAWLKAVERGDRAALGSIFDDQFIILSSSTRDKAQEIADLVPVAGAPLPYFKSDGTRSWGFGALALTTGVLSWEFNGRRSERQYASIAVNRGGSWTILTQQVTPVR